MIFRILWTSTIFGRVQESIWWKKRILSRFNRFQSTGGSKGWMILVKPFRVKLSLRLSQSRYPAHTTFLAPHSPKVLVGRTIGVQTTWAIPPSLTSCHSFRYVFPTPTKKTSLSNTDTMAAHFYLTSSLAIIEKLHLLKTRLLLPS